MMGCSPREVSTWPWEDIVYILAYCAEEEAELKAARSGVGNGAGSSKSQSRTFVYRKAE
ncbi:hypothetical protein JGU66_18760 [Myxococcaceae bacterium JPH2]|nr:hypothetical protein [Myxococcaceae bacterium JPH2]